MDFKDIVRLALEEVRGDLLNALDGLTAEERCFQPDPESHHIDFALWHIARVEDDWVQRFARRADSVWRRDGWHTRFGMPATGGGTGYTPQQVADFPAFDLAEMLEYYDAMGSFARQVLEVFALGLDLERNFFQWYYRKPLMQLRLMHYPPHDPGDNVPFGVRPHSDAGAFSMLL